MRKWNAGTWVTRDHGFLLTRGRGQSLRVLRRTLRPLLVMMIGGSAVVDDVVVVGVVVVVGIVGVFVMVGGS